MQEENRCRETLCTSPASVLCLVASLFACDSGLLVPGSRTAVTPTQACEADREETRPRQGVSRCSSLPQAAFLHGPSLENNVACSFPPGSEAWPAGALARPRAAPGRHPLLPPQLSVRRSFSLTRVTTSLPRIFSLL